MEVKTLNPDEAVLTREGKSVRRAEFFWLCDRCASQMTLEPGSDGTVVVTRLDGDLRAAS
jgi:hypothetical protein